MFCLMSCEGVDSGQRKLIYRHYKIYENREKRAIVFSVSKLFGVGTI